MVSNRCFQFDDGGPATYKTNKGQHVLVGIINRYLEECGKDTILTRVSMHRRWIDDILKIHNDDAIFCAGGGDADD